MTTGVDVDADRPLRRDAERNRQRILESARELFATRGFEVTLDDIAHHAGVGVGTVYRRFPSREHLVEALFSSKLDEVAAWAQEGLDNPDPWGGLSGFIERAAESLVDNRGLQDALFSRTYGQDHVARARERIAPMVDTLITRCHEAGVIRPDMVGVDLPFIQFMLAAIIEYTESAQPGLWRRYLAIMLDGLRPQASPLPVPAPGVELLEDVQTRWRPPRRPQAPGPAE